MQSDIDRQTQFFSLTHSLIESVWHGAKECVFCVSGRKILSGCAEEDKRRSKDEEAAAREERRQTKRDAECDGKIRRMKACDATLRDGPTASTKICGGRRRSLARTRKRTIPRKDRERRDASASVRGKTKPKDDEEGEPLRSSSLPMSLSGAIIQRLNEMRA